MKIKIYNLILLLLCMTMLNACEAEPLTQVEEFKYTSFEVPLETDFLTTDFSQNYSIPFKSIELTGKLYIPKDAKTPMPAVIFQHGSGGINPLKSWYKQITATLNAHKIAVLIADSHTPRGLDSTANDQTALSAATRMLDTVQALKTLAKDHRIDAQRIAISGDSYGGFIAMRLAEEPIMELLAPEGERFAAHGLLYPACNATPNEIDLSSSPLLFLLGESDDYTYARDCLAYIDRLQEDNYDVRHHVFSQAYHGWLYNIPPIYFARAQTFNRCQLVFEDDLSMTLVDYELSSRGLDLAEFYDEVFESGCVSLGAHVGANAVARRESLRLISDFFVSVLEVR